MKNQSCFDKNIDWEKFLSSCDIKFNNIKYTGGYYTNDEVYHGVSKSYKRDWDNGLFIGNGMIGAMIYKYSENELVWELSRNDVIAHNYLADIDWATPRVPIGNIILSCNETIINENMRLCLWNAQVYGNITTNKGKIIWNSISVYNQDIIIIDIKTTCKENNASFFIQPRHGISDRIYFSNKQVDLNKIPPYPLVTKFKGVDVCIQSFINNKGNKEGECAFAWYEKVIDEYHKQFIVSIKNSYKDDSAHLQAINCLLEYKNKEYIDILNTHRKWWNEYYKLSFLSIDDTYWQKFYWIQMYKLASATKKNGVILDSQGPWMTLTPWPTTVWNLNVQLSYSPIYTSNRLFLLDSLINVLKTNKQTLINNAKPLGIDNGMYIGRATCPISLDSKWPDTYELGNILWAIFMIWRMYDITNDNSLLNDLLYPYLKMAINSCMVLTYKGEDNKLHIKDTSSPEYPSKPHVNWYPIVDCNYTLSLYKWALKTILSLNDKLNIHDPLETKWQSIYNNLVDYPINKNGYMIGRNVPLTKSHRHFSHLFMLYPLQLVDINNEFEISLAEKSIKHWTSLMEHLQGYTFTSASAMMSILQKGNEALDYLNGLKQFISPNTMYSEKGPVIETPISAAEAIHYMLIQTYNNIIKIFPAVPQTWSNVEFRDFMTGGGFSVSAKLTNGKTTTIKIKSLLGNLLNIKLNDNMSDFIISGDRKHNLKQYDNYINIDLCKGETVLFTRRMKYDI